MKLALFTTAILITNIKSQTEYVSSVPQVFADVFGAAGRACTTDADCDALYPIPSSMTASSWSCTTATSVVQSDGSTKDNITFCTFYQCKPRGRDCNSGETCYRIHSCDDVNVFYDEQYNLYSTICQPMTLCQYIRTVGQWTDSTMCYEGKDDGTIFYSEEEVNMCGGSSGTCVIGASLCKPPTYNPTPSPTGYPTTDPTKDPTIDPTHDPTNNPTNNPTSDPTRVPSTDPTNKPTKNPTADPTHDPTIDPSLHPTKTPTSDPTNDPTTDPTFNPTTTPTTDPTNDPTEDPTDDPTIDPTIDPTLDPTKTPTIDPTNDPSQDPTMDPTNDPTHDPTSDPTSNPISAPTPDPTIDPTNGPTNDPSNDPTMNPSNIPSSTPTFSPSTMRPTTTPSLFPTNVPTIKSTLWPTSAPTLAPTPTCHHAKYKGMMKLSDFLWGGESLVSINCRYLLTLKKNGNLTLYGLDGKYEELLTYNWYIAWSTNTSIHNYSQQSVAKLVITKNGFQILEYFYKNVPAIQPIVIYNSINHEFNGNYSLYSHSNNHVILTNDGCLFINGDILYKCSSFMISKKDESSTSKPINDENDEDDDDNKGTQQDVDGYNNNTNDNGLWWLWWSLIMIFILLLIILIVFVKRYICSINEREWKLPKVLNPVFKPSTSSYIVNEESEEEQIERWMGETNGNHTLETQK